MYVVASNNIVCLFTQARSIMLISYLGFNSEDHEVEQAAQTLFETRTDLVKAIFLVKTLAGESVEQFNGKTKAYVALSMPSRLEKCGIPIKRPNQGPSDSG